MDKDGFDMINHINDGMSRWSSFDKRLELVTKSAHYINRMNELNATCNKKHQGRDRRQIDSAMMSAVDFGLKKIEDDILTEKLNEFKNLDVGTLNSKSKSE